MMPVFECAGERAGRKQQQAQQQSLSTAVGAKPPVVEGRPWPCSRKELPTPAPEEKARGEVYELMLQH